MCKVRISCHSYQFLPITVTIPSFPSFSCLLTCPGPHGFNFFFFFFTLLQYMIYLLLQILCLSWKTFPNLGSTVGGLFPIDTTGQTVPPVLHSLPVALLHIFQSCIAFFTRVCFQSSCTKAKLCSWTNNKSVFLHASRTCCMTCPST